MKIKSLFVALVALTVALVSCDEKKTEPTFKVIYDGTEYVEDADVTVTEADIFGTMSFDFAVKNLGSKDVNATITEVRHFDATVYLTQLCIDNCVAGNGEKTQVWEFLSEGNYTKEMYAHVQIPTEKKSEDAELLIDYIFEDGVNKITFHVKYDYKGVATEE